jgi:hypothetical protein
VQTAWARRTDAFVKIDRVSVPVGTLTTVLFAPINLRGYENAVVFLDNDGTDTFDGLVEFSPDGVYPGVVEADSAFEAVAPGTGRWTKVPGDAQFFRVTGQFQTLAGSVRVSVILQRGGVR